MHLAGQTAAIGPGQRLVTLVLCDASGALLGELGPFLCRPQYWPEMDEVVATARSDFGLEVTALRMLSTEAPYAGGAVSYLAQLTAGSRLTPLPPVGAEQRGAVDSDPTHRLWWAEPGWLHEVEDWVDDALCGHGRSRTGRSRTGRLHQRRTWNPSCILTSPTTSGTVWIKAVPPFLADDVEHCLSVGAADGRTGQIVTEVRHTLDPARDLGALATPELAGLEELAARTCRGSWLRSTRAACLTPSSTGTCIPATGGAAAPTSPSSTGAAPASATRRSTCGRSSSGSPTPASRSEPAPSGRTPGGARSTDVTRRGRSSSSSPSRSWVPPRHTSTSSTTSSRRNSPTTRSTRTSASEPLSRHAAEPSDHRQWTTSAELAQPRQDLLRERREEA